MIPIFISGKEAGSANIYVSGAYTVIEADIKHIEGIVRLYAHGAGTASYLGIPYPAGGGMRLVRKLSRSELASFPSVIDSISDIAENYAKAEHVVRSVADTSWKTRSDGTLRRNDVNFELVAIPCRSDKEYPFCRVEKIGTKRYMIFRY